MTHRKVYDWTSLYGIYEAFGIVGLGITNFRLKFGFGLGMGLGLGLELGLGLGLGLG